MLEETWRNSFDSSTFVKLKENILVSSWSQTLSLRKTLYVRCLTGFWIRFLLFCRTHLRSSRLLVFCKISILENLAKFTGEHLYRNFYFNKVGGSRFTILLNRGFRHRFFPVNFAKNFREAFYGTPTNGNFGLFFSFAQISLYSENTHAVDLFDFSLSFFGSCIVSIFGYWHYFYMY